MAAPQAPPPDLPRVVRTLHGALTAGMALATATFVFLIRVRHGQGYVGDSKLGVVLAALGVGLLAVALGVLRRRIPERAPEQTPVGFWSAESVSAAIMLWAVVEAAGLMGLVGYLLTGETIPVVVAGLAVATLLLLGPGRLEGEGAG
jgi:hypothetical protein